MAINRELAALSVLFNRCREWKKYEGENPLRSMKKIDEPLTRLCFLSEDEETALLGRCDEPLTGLRVTAEALTLKIEHRSQTKTAHDRGSLLQEPGHPDDSTPLETGGAAAGPDPRESKRVGISNQGREACAVSQNCVYKRL